MFHALEAPKTSSSSYFIYKIDFKPKLAKRSIVIKKKTYHLKASQDLVDSLLNSTNM